MLFKGKSLSGFSGLYIKPGSSLFLKLRRRLDALDFTSSPAGIVVLEGAAAVFRPFSDLQFRYFSFFLKKIAVNSVSPRIVKSNVKKKREMQQKLGVRSQNWNVLASPPPSHP